MANIGENGYARVADDKTGVLKLFKNKKLMIRVFFDPIGAKKFDPAATEIFYYFFFREVFLVDFPEMLTVKLMHFEVYSRSRDEKKVEAKFWDVQ